MAKARLIRIAEHLSERVASENAQKRIKEKCERQWWAAAQEVEGMIMILKPEFTVDRQAWEFILVWEGMVIVE